MSLAEGSTFAGYTIVRRLGAGGMGEVYLAQHPRLPRRDALKVLLTEVSADDEYRERFEREADIAATLWHPHIVGVHDRGDVDGRLWISMDYVDGTDAARLLREQHPDGMPSAEVGELITAVAEALDYAHARHLLHRDVKPGNVLIAHPDTPDRRIMLADFGIARWSDDPSGLTATNMTVGTVSYAAPEQLMGTALDGRADQYALAASAYHLLTGSPPFQNSNPAIVISQHLSATPPAIGERKPDLAGLDPVLAKALAKDPRDRYDTCAEFADALTRRLDGATPPPAERPLLRAGVVVPAVLAVLLVAAVVFALVELNRADDERAGPSATPTVRTTTSGPPTTSTTPAPATNPSTTATGPAAFVGADCSPVGTTGVTTSGATAYCVTVAGTAVTIWSLHDRDVPIPTYTPAPTETPLAPAEESPVRICMQETGQSWLRCREDIRRSNGAG